MERYTTGRNVAPEIRGIPGFNFRRTPLRQQLLNLLRGDGSTVAWYQPGVGVTGTLTASAWANQLGAAGSLAQATAGNQPIVLPFSGTRYLYCPGVNANQVKSTDTVFTSQSQIDFIARIALNNWSNASIDQYLDTQTDTLAPHFQVGTMKMWNGNNSTMAVTLPALTNGTFYWFRWKFTNSGGTDKVDFYYAPDQTYPVASWTQIETQKSTAAGQGAKSSGTGIAIAASYAAGVNPLAGKISRSLIYTGFVDAGGTLVSDMNATDWSETSTNGATQVSSTTGETWTLNNTGAKPAQIVGSPSLLFDGTADYMATGAETLDQPMTAYLVGRQITWTDNDLILDGATADTLGLKQTTTTPSISLNAGAEAAEDANLTLGLNSVITVVLNGASSSIKVNANAATTGNAGAGNPSGLVLGAVATPGSYGNIQVKEVIIRNVADSAATQAKIQALLKALHGTP